MLSCCSYCPYLCTAPPQWLGPLGWHSTWQGQLLTDQVQNRGMIGWGNGLKDRRIPQGLYVCTPDQSCLNRLWNCMLNEPAHLEPDLTAVWRKTQLSPGSISRTEKLWCEYVCERSGICQIVCACVHLIPHIFCPFLVIRQHYQQWYLSDHFTKHSSDFHEDRQPLTGEHNVTAWTVAEEKLSLSTAGTRLMFPWLFRLNSNSGH